MNPPIPDFFRDHNEAYNKIVKMAEEFPNDQEFGKEIRKYLNDIKENGFWRPKHIEFDTKEPLFDTEWVIEHVLGIKPKK